MKKLVSIVLSLILTVSLFAACSKEHKEENKAVITPNYEIVKEVPQERLAGSMQPAEHFAGGDGSENNPYQISTPAELQLFSDVVNNQKLGDDLNYAEAYYILDNDIEFNSVADMEKADEKAPSYAWVPIGQKDDDKGSEFKGHFDGNDKTITGLYVISAYHGMDDSRAFIGMFSKINNAEIKDLTLSNSYFYSYNGIDSLAAVVGQAYCSTIDNCHTKDTYCYATSAEAAQILGHSISNVNISNCTASGKVESSNSQEIAGIAASVNDGTIENCINDAEIVNQYGTASGICGLLSDSAPETDNDAKIICVGKTTVINCKNNGTISAPLAGAAGISARISSGNSEIELNKCENSGVIKGKTEIGGIAGSVISSKNSVGRSDGKTNQGLATVKECINTGNINADNGNAGGICGHISTEYQAKINIENNNNEDCVVSGSTVGGIVGIQTNGINNDSGTTSVASCSNSGAFGDNPSSAGGIFGTVSLLSSGRDTTGVNISIEDCINDTDFDFNTVGYGTGGIVGFLNLQGITGDSISFNKCTNNGDFKAVMNANSFSFLGGVCGASDSVGEEIVTIKDCINNGSFDITLISTEKTTSADNENKENNSVLCYVGGVCGGGCERTAINNCSNKGNFNLVSGDKNKILYDDIMSLKYAKNDELMQAVRQQIENEIKSNQDEKN